MKVSWLKFCRVSVSNILKVMAAEQKRNGSERGQIVEGTRRDGLLQGREEKSVRDVTRSRTIGFAFRK